MPPVRVTPSDWTALDACLERHPRVVLAVSGGLDSMCLLDLVAERRPVGCEVTVATLDHRSAPGSADAVRHVRREARARGLPVVAGRAVGPESTEAGWRRARWAFLRSVAGKRGAIIATAHTADDHLETVVMRALRGAGAWGLAGLSVAAAGVVRPLVGVPRERLANYAGARGLRWVDDPTNADPRWLRNRVRRDLLPALTRADPAFAEGMLALSLEASQWRARLADLVSTWARREPGGALVVEAEPLASLDPAGRLVAWQAIIGARLGTLPGSGLRTHGFAMDRRGLARLASVDPRGRTGLTVPLSGGLDVVVLRSGLRVSARGTAPGMLRGVEDRASVAFGPWVFRWSGEAETSGGSHVSDEQGVWVGAGAEVVVRAWEPGDRLVAGERPARRVARFLADAGIAGPLRRGWPVVLADGEIIWIPGVRRANAAPVRPGRPVRRLECERSSG